MLCGCNENPDGVERLLTFDGEYGLEAYSSPILMQIHRII